MWTICFFFLKLYMHFFFFFFVCVLKHVYHLFFTVSGKHALFCAHGFVKILRFFYFILFFLWNTFSTYSLQWWVENMLFSVRMVSETCLRSWGQEFKPCHKQMYLWHMYFRSLRKTKRCHYHQLPTIWNIRLLAFWLIIWNIHNI